MDRFKVLSLQLRSRLRQSEYERMQEHLVGLRFSDAADILETEPC